MFGPNTRVVVQVPPASSPPPPTHTHPMDRLVSSFSSFTHAPNAQCLCATSPCYQPASLRPQEDRHAPSSCIYRNCRACRLSGALLPSTADCVGGVRQNLSKAEYNDKWGKVLEYDRAAGRYVVALSAQQNLKLKPANVRI